MTASRNPWPWAIGLFIGCFAIAMASFVIWSLRHRQDLVMPDYYEQELSHQARMEANARARQQAEHALRYDTRAKTFAIELPVVASNVQIALYRPSDASLDRTLTVDMSARPAAPFAVTDLKAGLWRAHLTWLQDGAAYRDELAFIVE